MRDYVRSKRGRLSRLPLLLCIALWVALHLRMADLSALPLIPDEGYYWLWSRHLDWAYYDHPAGTALLLRLSTSLGGQGEFGIRWLNALLGTVCVALVWALATRLSYPGARGTSRGRTSPFAAWIVALGAPYLIISRFVYTDVLFLFLMLLNFRFFLSILVSPGPGANPTDRAKSRFPAFTGWAITLALLLNTKYTVFLYIGALGLWLLVRRHPLLRDRRFWMAGGLGTLGLLPVLGWNAAYDWVSFRWQLAHLLTTSPGAAAQSLTLIWARNAVHATRYLTWPVAASALLSAALVGTYRFRRRPHACSRRHGGMCGLLELLSLSLLAPVLLSPSGSPRNLLGGLVFLFLRVDASGYTRSHPMRAMKLGLAAMVALYGMGTIGALRGAPIGLESSVVAEIRRDTAGMREVNSILALPADRTLFAVDYSLAGQLAYYTGRPVTTSWGQYRLWAQPDFSNLILISLPYIPRGEIEDRLRRAFTVVDGPYSWQDGHGRQITWWQAGGLRWSPEEVLEAFDFFALAEKQP